MSENLATVGLRLMPEVDAEMRNHVRRRGDLAKLIAATLEGVDLAAIPLLQVTFAEEGASETLCKIPAKLYKKAKSTASERGVSTNCLLNSAINAYTKMLTKKQPRPSRR
jgi:hypothetical protein